MLSLQGLAFASPWVLLGFVVIPALWWLVRVTPPAPTVVAFPAIRLLAGLRAAEETPARTPLWLILLRMLLASLLILALAHPLLNPSVGLPGRGPLLLVIDDGWTAASGWTLRRQAATALVDRAEREGRQVAILTTAPTQAAAPPSLMRPADARALLAKLEPKPWPVDRHSATDRLAAAALHGATVYWLSDGLHDGATAAPGALAGFARALMREGPATILQPRQSELPLLLAPGPPEAADLSVVVKRIGNDAALPIDVRAIGLDGGTLAEASSVIPAGAKTATVALKMPPELRNRAARIDLVGDAGLGAVRLLDDSAQRRPVGVVSDTPAGNQQPLLSQVYYLERALQPFAELRRNTAAALMDSGVSMILLPDADAPAPEIASRLESWVEKGGVLVRFAGPLLAAAESDKLLPVTLRRGDRSIGGAMSWEKPAHPADFSTDSPFSGLAVPSDVTVDRQVLAEPAADLPTKTWARLTDGTPLVTGERRNKGWLVLVHTTANTSWSNLAISGLFVDLLRRLEQLSTGEAAAGNNVLRPWQVMDGFGRLGPASAEVQPVSASMIGHLAASPEHPPGLYGTEDSHGALNIAPGLDLPPVLGELPAGMMSEGYVAAPEFDLRPALLSAAFVLLLIDLIVGYRLRRIGPRRGDRLVAAAIAGIVFCANPPAHAAENPSQADQRTIQATDQLHLAYVKTGDDAVDHASRDGLAGLGAVLARRTSVDTGEPMSVDVERDEMVFFPLIYWPITDAQQHLSADAVARVNRYIDTGGTILFDTRDQGYDAGSSAAASRLNTLLAGVHIPQLVQVPADHVLTKSFYLMQDFPGRYIGGTLWVEPVEDRINDGVSTVIVGANDWSSAWALDAQGIPEFPCVPGGESQREMAYRFGVNLVMYALTGNYKADQVHVPAILERLGQ
jgi:hypothetical protein